MDDKVLVKLIVPEIDSVYDVYLPISKKWEILLFYLIKQLMNYRLVVFRFL